MAASGKVFHLLIIVRVVALQPGQPCIIRRSCRIAHIDPDAAGEGMCFLPGGKKGVDLLVQMGSFESSSGRSKFDEFDGVVGNLTREESSRVCIRVKVHIRCGLYYAGKGSAEQLKKVQCCYRSQHFIPERLAKRSDEFDKMVPKRKDAFSRGGNVGHYSGDTFYKLRSV